jgi:hypothetical protein
MPMKNKCMSHCECLFLVMTFVILLPMFFYPESANTLLAVAGFPFGTAVVGRMLRSRERHKELSQLQKRPEL